MDNLRDLVAKHDLDGLWIDMIGWFSSVCHCPQLPGALPLRETGHELPRKVDWDSSAWVEFQAKRGGMARGLRGPDAPGGDGRQAGNHPRPPVHLPGRRLGRRALPALPSTPPTHLAGDFQVAAVPQSVVCKTLNSLGRNKPVEFMSPQSEGLALHTGYMTEAKLRMTALAAPRQQTPALFSSTPSTPKGTMREASYPQPGRRQRRAGALTSPSSTLAATLKADVALYWGMESMTMPPPTTASRPTRSNAATSTCCGSTTWPRRSSPPSSPTQSSTAATSAPCPPASSSSSRRSTGWSPRTWRPSAGTSAAAAAPSTPAAPAPSTSRKEGRHHDLQLADVLGGQPRRRADRRGRLPRPPPPPPSPSSAATPDATRPADRRPAAGQVHRRHGPGDPRPLPPRPGGGRSATRFNSAISDPPGAVWTDSPALTLNRFGAGQALYCALASSSANEFDRDQEVFAQLGQESAAPARRPLAPPTPPKGCEFILFRAARRPPGEPSELPAGVAPPFRPSGSR